MVQAHYREPEGDQREAVVPAIPDAAEVEVPPIECGADCEADDDRLYDADGGAEPANGHADGVGQMGAEEDNPGALPSQQRGDGCLESYTRCSGERRLPAAVKSPIRVKPLKAGLECREMSPVTKLVTVRTALATRCWNESRFNERGNHVVSLVRNVEDLKSKLDHVADKRLNLDPGRFGDLRELIWLYDREGV